MNESQRAAAERLADELARIHGHRTALETIALLRELAAEPVLSDKAVSDAKVNTFINALDERGRTNALLSAIREHWVKANGEDSLSVAALDTIAEVIADGSYVAQPKAEPVQDRPVAWPARHVSLKQRKDKTLRLTLDLDAVEGWPNYWVMRYDSRCKCSTPNGCAAHGCHGECLQTAPQQRRPLNKMHACDDPLCAVCGHGITGETT